MKEFKKEQTERMHDRAFTLTELLAVVATLAMVVLVVLPAMARSSNGSVRAVCFNNLRQMGIAVGMYANDNQDYLAFCDWANPAPAPGWLYNGTSPDPTMAPYYPNNIAGAYTGGLWFQYINDPKAYLCPLDIQSPGYAFRNNKLCSYLMNGSPNGFSGGTTTCKITDAWNPGCYLLWETDENAAGPGNPGAFEFNSAAIFPDNPDGIPSKLHTLNGSEFLCVGGNVNFVSTNQFNAAQNTSKGKTLAWWHPTTTNGH